MGINEAMRLEDFIKLAKEGKKIEVEIELEKKNITEKLPGKEVNAYLLIATYLFKHNEKTTLVSKVYMMGFMEESLNLVRTHKNIANARLKMDYRRLKEANIKFREKFFE
jgi:hypothetical protein